MRDPKVPNTITDQKMADLRRRAAKAEPPMFSRKAVERRKAASVQLRKRGAN
jgi:hypothetical protein